MITQHDRDLLLKDFQEIFATKKDLGKFATKNDLKRLKNDLLEAIYSMGDMLLKDTRNAIDKHDDLLENHERRIIKLEGKAFS